MSETEDAISIDGDAPVGESLEDRVREFIGIPTAADIISTVYPEEMFWIGPTILPYKGRLMLVGKTGVGKSLVSLHLAHCLASGDPVFNALRRKKDKDLGKPLYPITKRVERILYVDFEFSETMRKPRLMPLFAGCGDRVIFPRETQFLGLQNFGPEDPNFKNLEAVVSVVKPDVLFIDPLSSAHTYNENTSEIKPVLLHLDHLIKTYGLSVVVSVHESSKETKDMYGNPVERSAVESARGWTGVTDWFDTQIQIAQRRAPIPDRLFLKMRFGKVRHGFKQEAWKNFDVVVPTMSFIWAPLADISGSEDD